MITLAPTMRRTLGVMLSGPLVELDAGWCRDGVMLPCCRTAHLVGLERDGLALFWSAGGRRWCGLTTRGAAHAQALATAAHVAIVHLVTRHARPAKRSAP